MKCYTQCLKSTIKNTIQTYKKENIWPIGGTETNQKWLEYGLRNLAAKETKGHIMKGYCMFRHYLKTVGNILSHIIRFERLL